MHRLGKQRLRGRRFSIRHAMVLFVLIGFAQIVGSVTVARDTKVTDIRKTFSNHVFEGKTGVVRMVGEFREKGDLEMRGPLGQFGGTWRDFAGEICVDLLNGPSSGLRCVWVIKVADGHFETEDGVQLRRIASVRRF